MTFKNAVENTPYLEDKWRAGLQALQAADRRHVDAEDTRRLRGSVDLDTALKQKPKFRSAPRWDYAVGHQPANVSGEVVYWIEMHSAADGKVKGVLNKLRWLKRWLEDDGASLKSMRKAYIWVSSGKTAFTKTAPQRKKLAAQGLQHVGRRFTIPNEAPF